MFIGHITDIPNNHKKPLPQYNNKKLISNNNGNLSLMNNICPHQGSLIISEMKEKIQCQYHGWSWDDEGNPHSNGVTQLCNNTHLNKKNVFVENGIITSLPIDISCVSHVDLSFMRLAEHRIETVNTDYRNIIDVFLDVDHIPVVHPEVYTQVGVANQAEVKWKYFDWGNIQMVKRTGQNTPEYQSSLLGTDEERLSAFWVTIYPYVTIDWQPGSLFVMCCVPKSDTVTDVVIYKYRDTRYNDNNWRINNDIWETAWVQDKHQAEVIVARTIAESNLEEAKIHFRNWENR